MNLDTRTVVATIAISLTVISLALFVTSRSYPDRVRRTAVLWAQASALQAVGWTLIASRDVVPDVLSIVVGNTLLTTSVAGFYHALKEYNGDRVRIAAIYWPSFLVFVTFVYLALSGPTYVIRVVTISVLGAVQMAVCSAILFARCARRTPLSGWLTGLGFALGSATLIVRGAGTLLDIHTSPMTGLFRPDPAEQITFLALFVAIYMFSFGFLLMCNETITLDLERLATLDPLTERYNRRTIEDLARREISRSRRNNAAMSIAMVDLDHFKRVNDTFGHPAGDAALRHVVDRMSALLRAEDLVGRYGGEEFIVVMPNTDGNQALAVAERLRGDIAKTEFVAAGQTIPLTASIGIASLAGSEIDFDALVEQADRALYAAKAEGRNRVLVAPSGWRETEPAT